MKIDSTNIITYFPDEQIAGLELPVRFTNPFGYEPHMLTEMAAAALQHYLETAKGLDHNFGLTENDREDGVGKMFGVLVVEDEDGKVGYLQAFSGKLAGANAHEGFVPPVFDMLEEGGFFVKGIGIINALNQRVKMIETGEDYIALKQELAQSVALAAAEIAALKQHLTSNKAARKKEREQVGIKDLSHIEAVLAKQSVYDKHVLAALADKWNVAIGAARAGIAQYDAEVDALKNERKEKSAALQELLFEQYEFLNKAGERKSLKAIFEDAGLGAPPSAAGECATPKLLQYAFVHGYKPRAMGEFWWGVSPRSEARKHRQFYPACEERCRPILQHMLAGMEVEGGDAK